MTAKEKYFKDKENNVWGFNADGSQDDAISDKLIPITFEEMMGIINPPLTAEQLIAEAEIIRASLRAEANSEIEWRQDAVDSEMATADEKTELAEWKKYRVMLMRVSSENPEWPKKPNDK